MIPDTKVIHMDQRRGALAQTLRHLADQVDAGEVLGAVIVYELTGWRISSYFATAQSGNLLMLLGSLAVVKRRILAHFEGE